MLPAIVNACKSFFHHIQDTVKNFIKPETAVLAASAMSDITHSCKDLVQEIINLIKDMAQKNWLWGAEKIQSELLKLGIKVSKRTIQKYIKKVRKR